MLTRKQLDLLKFIHARSLQNGVSPSFDEMKEALNLRSKSGIHRLITALEERGFIRRLAHRARAIEILKMPEGMEAPRSPSNVIEADFSRKPPSAVELMDAPNANEVPLMGRIAAGTPIEAIAHPVERVTVPGAMVSGGADHYALEVKGDSMIDAGIHEGDIVVVKSQDRADDGDIVVALVRDQEATLKTLRRAAGQIQLHAANQAYETQKYDARDVKIQGKMVGLIRTY